MQFIPKELMGYIKTFTIFIIIIITYFYLSSNDTNLPDKKVENALKLFFQEKFLEVECIGNNPTFRYINNKYEPENTFVPFKAKVNIDNIDRTIVGTLKVSAFKSHQQLFFSWPFTHFTTSLDEWHFVANEENTLSYCNKSIISKFISAIDDTFSNFELDDNIKIINMRGEVLYQDKIENSYYKPKEIMISDEIKIYTKLCEFGDEKSCKTMEKWNLAKSAYRTAIYKDKKSYYKMKLEALSQELFSK